MSVVTKNWAALIGLAVVTAGVTGSGGAQALPQFTFAPSGAGLNGTSFTADNFQISDFATVVNANTSATTQSFTDNGTLAVIDFTIGSNGPISTPGLNSTYGLYLNFAATGTQTVSPSGNTAGTFSTLNFTLYGYNRAAGDNITYLADNATPLDNGSVIANPIALAAGALVTGTVSETGGSPSAAATTSFTLEPNETSFFVSPVPFFNLAISQFGNTTSEVATTPTGFVITAGGGTVNFATQAVPEPGSLVLLGAGLTAVGLIRRRKRL